MAVVRSAALACLATLLFAGQASAQVASISGRITDALTLQPIIGARIDIEGTARGTTAGAEGRFSLTEVAVGAVRVTARAVGYAPQTREITVTAGQVAVADFALERQAAVMDEIVVTGYGEQRRVAITGAVATVNADEANVGVVSSANDMLQGRVSGVHITQNHGEPGAGIQIRIRGGSSISASDEPLYVVDGVVIQNLPTEPAGIGIDGDAALPRNPLTMINPADIKSITVLKDAAAAAIYGARSANGVVLIETKQGERDRTTFEYDTYVSVASPSRRLDVLSGDQYRQFIEEQVAAGVLDTSRLSSLGSANTNWEREVTRSALTHNHNIAFSGGTQSTQYRASLNYTDQEGVALSSAFERFQGRLNALHSAWGDRLRLGLNLTASHVNNDYLPFEDTGGFEGGVFQNMAIYNPTRPVMVTDSVTGEPVFYEAGTGAQSVRNPVALAEQISDFGKTTRVLGNVRAVLDIVPSLQGQLLVGVDRSQATRQIYFPRTNPVGAEFNGLARQEDRDLTTISLQGLLTWSTQFGDASELEVIGGYEFNDYTEGGFASEARDFLTDAFSFNNLSAGARAQNPSSYRNDSRLIGFFSRATVGFNDRYFLTGVLRRDGSSRFGPENKWATFPAISGSWRLSEENFMRDRLFSELRLRAGYGVQGNEAAQPYASLLLLAPSDQASYPFGDTRTVGVAPSRNPNPDLRWEQTKQFNVGLDYGFSDNRIAGSLEYYVKNTTNLLLEVTVPQPAAVATRLENIGKVRNRGLEATLDALLVTRENMSWQAGLVFAAERNTVVELGDATFIRTGDVSGQGQSGQVAQRILPGEPLGTFFGPEFVGWDDQGRQLFNQYEVERDSAGREISRALIGQTTTPGGDDFVPIGNANPNFTLGFRSQLRWGAFDASLIARWEQGRDVFNNTALVYSTKGNALQDKNFLASALDDPTDINEPSIYSSRWIEDGSFLRLQNITVGYTFEMPRVLTSLANTARIYVSADNLLLLTGYSGYDPEAHSSAGLASRGIDYLSYPRPRVFTAGLRLSF
jgi:iron complex outermembrane receptor protein